MVKTSQSYTYTLSILFVTFLVLFIVYCAQYYNLKNKKVDKVPIPVIPAWEPIAIAGNGNKTLSDVNVLNQYVLRTIADAATDLTFPSAASVVAAAASADDRLVVAGQEFYIVLNNQSGFALTYVAGTGNTKNANLNTLPDGDYEIIRVTLTDVTSGSEAVSYISTYTGP